MRTTEEILAYKDKFGPCLFGFDKEALLPYLSYTEARPWMHPDEERPDVEDVVVTAAGLWHEVKPRDRETVLADFTDYMLRIALDKAVNHRGISASRSITKLRALAWLMEDDEAVRLCDETDYAQYGTPKLRALCEHFGIDWAKHLGDEAHVFAAQAEGKVCPLCLEGGQSGCGE